MKKTLKTIIEFITGGLIALYLLFLSIITISYGFANEIKEIKKCQKHFKYKNSWANKLIFEHFFWALVVLIINLISWFTLIYFILL